MFLKKDEIAIYCLNIDNNIDVFFKIINILNVKLENYNIKAKNILSMKQHYYSIILSKLVVNTKLILLEQNLLLLGLKKANLYHLEMQHSIK